MKGIKTIQTLLGLLLFLSCLPRTVDADPTVVPEETYDLRLYDAIFQGESPGDGNISSLLLLLRRTSEGWERAIGTARDYNATVHSAQVNNVELTDDTFSLDLEVRVRADSYVSGGFASFRVDMERSADGGFDGTYNGTFKGVEIKGKARAEQLPAHDARPGEFQPVQPDQHPRILFRKSDLPKLRKKADTPFGKAMMKKMDGVIGKAVKYRLTEDASYAREIIDPIKKMIDKGMVSDQYGNNVGVRLEKTAIAYDLCRNVWPESFRRRVEFYLHWAGKGVLRARGDTHQGVNWHVCSNWSAPLYTGAAYAGLALWGQKGPRPEKPDPTHTGETISPANDYEPVNKVPVSTFENNEMPPEWIFAGGFKTKWVNGDPLSDLGGPENARPEVGTVVSFGDQMSRFQPVPHEEDEGYWSNKDFTDGKTAIDVTNAVDREYFSTNYFYTVIRNDVARRVRYVNPKHPGTAYVNGVPLRDGDVVRIKKGLYPVLIETYIGQTNPWGRHLMRPRFKEVSEKTAQRMIEARKAQKQREMANWKQRVKRWKRLGKMDLRYLDLFQRTRHMMYRFTREAVGNGGAQAEITHYSTIAEKGPSRYMSTYNQMFGYHVSPQKDMEHLLTRKIFAHVYPEDGEPMAQEINGSPAAEPGLFASLFPVVPGKWKPAVLWAWHRHAGFDGSNWGVLAGEHPARAFLHYPPDMDPVHPGKRMPLTWRAEDFGLYGFRNGWDGRTDFLLKVWLKSHHIGGWNGPNAGTFRLMGLGHVWAAGPTNRHRNRWEENVVQLPENPDINKGAGARATYVRTRKDGSGVISMDLDNVYATRATGPDGEKRDLYESYGNVVNNEAIVKSGISGMRSIGVDYSGKSGAPCLLVIVDRINGGGKRVWTWHVPGGKENKPGDVKRTSTDGNTFTVTKPDGTTMRGVFVTGQEPYAEVRKTTMVGQAASEKGKKLKRPVHGIFAEGSGHFFTVVTIQEEDPPDINVSGSGLDAEIQVGNRTVRFDGEKIVFGPGK